jgi:hypothetical protein
MTVRRVEAGYKPFLSTQGKFASDLGIAVDELFGLPPRRSKRTREAAATA